jgi:hypothetical protein
MAKSLAFSSLVNLDMEFLINSNLSFLINLNNFENGAKTYSYEIVPELLKGVVSENCFKDTFQKCLLIFPLS